MENIIDRSKSRLDTAGKRINDLKNHWINIQVAAQKSKEMEIMRGRLRDVEDGTKRFKTNGSELYQGQGGE